MKNIIHVLQKRGFIESMTSEELLQRAEKPLNVYVGFDPTANSLHLGNLVAIMGLAWFKRYGHNPIAIVGGATGMIGDPSGKSTERNLLENDTLQTNLLGIKRSLAMVLGDDITVLNNADWIGNFNVLDFLRIVGRYFRLGSMLAKESVKLRLASPEGISYTEFSYQLLQAYDFLHLYREYNVSLQMGGSDQWGNITAGCELIRKVTGDSVYGITFPLLTRSDGKKFGKSEEGTIWLNTDLLSPYQFYQYLFSVPDADISKMLKLLTFLDLEEIEEIVIKMKCSDYVPNTAQRRLAEEVTLIVHGEEGLREAQRITKVARPGGSTNLDEKTLLSLTQDLPSKDFSLTELIGMKYVDLLVKCDLSSSKGESRRMIIGGGIYVNNEKITDVELTVSHNHIISNKFVLLGVGKKKRLVVRIIT